MAIFPWLNFFHKPKRRIQRVLEIECLEDRLVPAPIATIASSYDTAAQTTLVADFTGDGKADVATWSKGRWNVMVSDGSLLTAPVTWTRWPTSPGWKRFIVADFNGDGKQDIAGLSATGKWYVGLSTGTGFTSSTWETPPRTSYVAYFAGDFNGDGMADIAGLTKSGELRVALSTGTSFQTTTWATGLTGRWTRIVTGDFNGDGKTDLAGLRVDQWTVAISTDSAFDAEDWGTGDKHISANRIWAGDFDGDDKTDLAWVTAKGNLMVDTSNGTAFDTSTAGTVAANAQRYLVGDYDGDGTDDIATVRGAAIILSYMNGGTIARQQPAGWSPGAAASYARDTDDDGKTDIVIKRSNGEWFFLNPTVEGISGATAAYVPYRGEVPPYLSSAPWNPNNSRTFVNAQSLWLQRQMDFNHRANYYIYVFNFRYELSRWAAEAKILGLTATPALKQFLAGKLDAKFTEVEPLLESLYPGLDDTKYRLLMTMNLVSGHYTFGKGVSDRTLWALLTAPVGNCAHLGNLVRELANIQGIAATHYALLVSYDTPFGKFGTGHNIVIADGLYIDAEINVAFDIGSLSALTRKAPLSRLPSLVLTHKVYGFYDWLNYPPIRNEQLSRGQDGGVLSSVYQFILGGIGQGDGKMWALSWHPK